FQFIPAQGYHVLFENLLDGIEVWYNTDYFKVRDDISYKLLVFTGQIDEYFDYRLGPLPYRSLRFVPETHDTDFFQKYVQINYPNDNEFTRIVEIKHATGQQARKTTIVKEFPSSNGPPFYPIPSKTSNELYCKYKALSQNLTNVKFLGRLGTYKYLNMDQVVDEALDFVSRLQI
ncbi:MAG: UDP-galactopyranose mutase, partial [Candidatus Sigynarchaeota archaeon]